MDSKMRLAADCTLAATEPANQRQGSRRGGQLPRGRLTAIAPGPLRMPRVRSCANPIPSQWGITTAASPHPVFPRPFLFCFLQSCCQGSRLLQRKVSQHSNDDESMRNAPRCRELG
jgi:hypothetical protein